MTTFEEAANNQAAELRSLFTNNPCFEMVKLIAHGAYGATFRIRYNNPGQASIPQDLVVKRAFGHVPDGRTSLVQEQTLLTRLAGNPHIVQLYDVPNNPLESAPQVDRRDWMIMEWVEYGELESFVKSAALHLGEVETLPNRLLWRFFLCLIRAQVALSYPHNGERIPIAGTSSGIEHGDIHSGNVLLGEPPMDDEHTITPILKLIDFGLAEVRPGASKLIEKENMYAIGQLMMELITLKGSSAFFGETGEFQYMGRTIRTDAGDMIPFPEAIDPALCTLVCACMASNELHRPALKTLLRRVIRGCNKKASDYENDPREEDDAISNLWREIVLNAPTIPKTSDY